MRRCHGGCNKRGKQKRSRHRDKTAFTCWYSNEIRTTVLYLAKNYYRVGVASLVGAGTRLFLDTEQAGAKMASPYSWR